MYLLKAEKDALILKSISPEQLVCEWPYKYLRRFGGDKRMFSIESGRRCKSGPGQFEFETNQGKQIFTSVNAAVSAQKSNNEEERCNSDTLESYNLIAADSATHRLYSDCIKEQTAINKSRLSKRLSSVISNVSEGMQNLYCDTFPDNQTRSPLSKSPVRFQYSFPSPPLLALHSDVTAKLSTDTQENRSTLYSESNPGEIHSILPLEPPSSNKSISRQVGKQQSSFTSRRGNSQLNQINGPLVPFPSQAHSSNNENNFVEKKIPSIVTTEHPEALYDTVYSGSDVPNSKNPLCQISCSKKNEHIYEVSDDCLLYDEAKELSAAWKTQGRSNDFGYEYPYNPSADDYAVPKQAIKDAPLRPPKNVPSSKRKTQNNYYVNVDSIISNR
ncbi:uncharacterized protein LOC116981149 [Amblyraja radiata]|uniref:uncharacterized protein LOC116981149 n=1 Tax=Amblyraja radiata TaxID=386614 RepID=UPI0014027A53|nr:uncharacterized protein LOC116981149 [Amblyraja radiata]